MGEVAYTHSFAKIYDDLMDGVPYDLWFRYLKELLSFYDKNPDKILDLACGTGNMSMMFARKGKGVTGIDGSKEMLKMAREKINSKDLKISFIHSDLRNFSLSKDYDFAFSVFDSLNYILSPEDMKKVFKNVYNVLTEDGIFIFDFNTIKRLMSIEPGTTMFKGDNYTCFWQDLIDREKNRWKVKLKIYLDENLNNHYQELHIETSYPLEQIKEFLYKMGFSEVHCYNAYTFKKASEKNNRVYFVCFKKKVEIDTIKKIGTLVKWKLIKIIYSFKSDWI